MKLRMPVIVALMVVMPGAAPASEPLWEPLPGLDRGLLIEFDRDSLARRDGQLTLWLRLNFAAPVASRRLSFRSAVAEHAIDCARRRHAVIRMTTYSDSFGEGEVIDRWDRSPQDWDWRSPLGDPADERIIAIACAQAAITHLSRPITTSPP